jgi:hypothetical protein
MLASCHKNVLRNGVAYFSEMGSGGNFEILSFFIYKSRIFCLYVKANFLEQKTISLKVEFASLVYKICPVKNPFYGL